MGSGKSKSLAELDAQEVSNAIAKLGKNYDVYADTSRDNGVDGTLLAGLTEQEFRETLDDLGITNRLHRRVFVKAFDSARQQKAALSTAMTKFYARLPETFGFSRATPPEELMAFDEIAQDAMYQCSSPSTIYAGVHLVTDDGQLSLASLIRDMNGNLKPTTAHNTEAMSMCAAIVKYEQGTTFTKRELWENLYLPEQGGDKQWYTGHVVMDEGGNRIGMVCMVDKGDGTGLDEGDRMLLLQQLAADAEYQLKLRLVLLERKLLLEHQIQQQDPVTLPALQPQSQQDAGQEDAVVLPANGLLKPVLQSQVDRRPNDFPSPEDIEKSGKNRASHELPAYNTGLASEEELYHLKKGFFDTVDSLGDLAQRPPIGKNDRERVAVVEALQLHQIAPNGEMAGQLKKLVFMALNLVGFSYGAIQFHDHEYQFSIAGVGGGTDVHACLDKLMKTLIVDNDGKPWLRSMRRDMAICNYPILSKRTFVIHDISKDDTFRWVAQMTPFLAYVGAPVINASGRVIATLCLFDTKIRNDFCKANEIQAEQLAQMILQSIENWSLRRDVMRLERDRMMYIAEGRKAEPPKDTATMVITDVQESTSLWEANASAMQEAIDCHDKVMRHFSTKYHGYEVDTEGDSFIFSFHDAIDAFRFALDVQRALFDAPWSKDLLTLGEACDDPSSSFRGLRVKIGIHTGVVRPINNCVTGRVTYSGETIAMTKNLESMSHGGQIISTFETWNSASYLAESVLDSPQVVDLGTHVVNKGGRADDGVIIKRIVQLVPASLSFNYFAARRHVLDPEIERPDQQSSTFHGRQFPPIKSKQQVSSSFHDAPYLDQKVTIAFLYTSEIEKRFEDNDTILASLNRLVGGSLTGTTGYQCQHNMLAFPDPLCAIKFGLHLLAVLESREPDLSKLIKIGLVHDTYLSMGPHHTTGRADYFGTVVNRAARVMSVAEIGTVCVGVGAQAHAAQIADPSICTRLVGVRMLKGVHEEIAIYECSLKSRR